MPELRDRIAAIELALQNAPEVEIPTARTPSPNHRHSLDQRFEKAAPEVEAAPAPTPAQEKSDPFEITTNESRSEKKYYDSIAARFGLGILDHEDFTEYIVYNAFVTNLRICPVHLTDTGHYYYVEHRSFLPQVPGVILRRGTDKEGSSVAVAHLPLTGPNSIGIGDFETRPQDVVWERMGKTGFWTHMRYEFEYRPPGGDRRAFHWIRTRNNVLDDQGDLVLVEQDRDGLILAEYLGQGLLKWKKRGRLRVRTVEAFGESWELVVLLTWASVVEVRTLVSWC